MLPTLRQLQYLKLLAHHGSFSRAAEAAHVTQPTLSAGIQELEKILGAAMVDRNRSGVILTAAGEEAKAGIRAQGDRFAAELDLVRRDELDAMKAVLTAEIASLREEIASLRAGINSASAPQSAQKASSTARTRPADDAG